MDGCLKIVIQGQWKKYITLSLQPVENTARLVNTKCQTTGSHDKGEDSILTLKINRFYGV